MAKPVTHYQAETGAEKSPCYPTMEEAVIAEIAAMLGNGEITAPIARDIVDRRGAFIAILDQLHVPGRVA